MKTEQAAVADLQGITEWIMGECKAALSTITGVGQPDLIAQAAGITASVTIADAEYHSRCLAVALTEAAVKLRAALEPTE